LIFESWRSRRSVVQHDCSSIPSQAPSHCRARICLLKGCESWFSPRHPLSRYCSQSCAAAARLWSRRPAAQRYRASERGRKRRQQQSCRYRERVRQRQEEVLPPPAEAEGHQEAEKSEKIPCCRPGCYEVFPSDRRSPLKKFCCALCREALRRVRQREARWSDASVRFIVCGPPIVAPSRSRKSHCGQHLIAATSSERGAGGAATSSQSNSRQRPGVRRIAQWMRPDMT